MAKHFRLHYNMRRILETTIILINFCKEHFITRENVNKKTIISLQYQYSMELPQEKENVQYTLISVIIHEGNSISSGHYYCDTLYFNTVIWWRCDEK